MRKRKLKVGGIEKKNERETKGKKVQSYTNIDKEREIERKKLERVQKLINK